MSTQFDTFDSWFPAASKQGPFPGGQPRLRLLCFPSSGTMEANFTQKVRGADRKLQNNALLAWAQKNDVQVLSVQLPGRGKRHKENFLSSLDRLASLLALVLAPHFNSSVSGGAHVPYAVLGHSMGCWAGYETVQALLKAGVPAPSLFVASCFPAPDIPLAERPWSVNAGMSEDEFKGECRGWGMSEAVLTTPHLWESFKHMIRADFTLFDEYPPPPSPPPSSAASSPPPPLVGSAPLRPRLPCPVAAGAAEGDARVPESLVRGWSAFARSPADFTLLPCARGPHLFVLDDTLKADWFERVVVPALEAKAFAAAPGSESAPAPPSGESAGGGAAAAAATEAAAAATEAAPAAVAAAAAAASPRKTSAAPPAASGAPTTEVPPQELQTPPAPPPAAHKNSSSSSLPSAMPGSAPPAAAATTTMGAGSAATTWPPPLRVLCLHGFGCCGAIFKKQTERLRTLVEAELADAAGGGEGGGRSGGGGFRGVEWEFVDSPSEVCWDPAAFEARLVTSAFPNLPNKQWMRRVAKADPKGATVLSDGSRLAAASEAQCYVDWEEPLRFVVRHLLERGPYDMLVGFSQGANLATLLTALQEHAPPRRLLAATRAPASAPHPSPDTATPPPPPSAALPTPTTITNPTGSEPPRWFKAVVLTCGSAFGWEEQWARCGDVLPEWKEEKEKEEGKAEEEEVSSRAETSGSTDNSNSNTTSSQGGTSPLFASELRTPSLHFVGASDPLKPASEALAASLFDPASSAVVPFTSGHRPPTQKAAASALATFMKENLL